MSAANPTSLLGLKTAAELRLPSLLGYERVAMSTAASVAKMMGFPGSRIEDLKTAVSEACINAIEHGNQGNENLTVVVILSMDATRLEVKVMDRGSGMHKKIESPDMERKMLGLDEPRGMGLFLIQALVDEVEWVSESVEGSYARLVIHLDKGAV